LRFFLEEAAGISKYKERRRETETRLNHTRDNLARLNDIREELLKQINHLQRQAVAAERFKSLKSEERSLKAQLLTLRIGLLHSELQQKQQCIRQEHDSLVGLQSHLAILEASNSEKIDQQQVAQNDLNQVQQLYMEQGAHLARLEQNINHHQQRYQQINEDLHQLQNQIENNDDLNARDEKRLLSLTNEYQQVTPQLEEQNMALELQAETLAQLEQSAGLRQSAWDNINQQLVKASQLAQQKQHELQQLEQQHQQLLLQQQKWHNELQQLEHSLSTLQANEVDSELLILQEQQQNAEVALSDGQLAIENFRQQLAKARGDCSQSLQQLTAQKAQLTGLETYQTQALKRGNGFSSSQLAQLGLSEAKRLLDLLTVEPGFEAAVESILGHFLQALCTDSMVPILNQLPDAQKQSLWLVDLAHVASHTSSNEHLDHYGTPLSTKVQGPAAILQLLSSVYLQSHAQINHHYPGLSNNITLIRADGLIINAGLLKIGKPAEEPQGVLERQRHMQELTQQIEQLDHRFKQHQADVELNEQQLEYAEQSCRQLQQNWQQLSQRCHQQQSVVQIRIAKQQQLHDRSQGLSKLIQQANEDVARINQQHEGLRDTWQTALSALNALNAERDVALEERDAQTESLQQTRRQAQALQHQVHQLKLQQQRLHTEKTALEQQCLRMHEQLAQLQHRRRTLIQASAETLEPLADWQMEVEVLLAQRFEQEQSVLDAKIKVQTLNESFRQVEQQRRECELAIEQQRTSLETLRLNAEALQTRWQSLQEQKQPYDQDVSEAESGELLDESALQQRLDDVAQKIQRLGAVNLTAIEEFETQTARKLYLDQQYQDLIDAITILENAIRTIDRETKTRFQETFTQVNENFQKLFPTVFAGGKAYLQLTGDDLLSTGVSIFAQPVGKRNSTIHLLSGGEKALTAVALVFAIFQINPAPFCMLDEVDAPLDDSNVSRFCQLVKIMSDKTQFIMVTHNKVAMEMAHQLMGVTMQEPGVSRLVAVDMKDAIAMVDG
jgi:chromosome segregation protein